VGGQQSGGVKALAKVLDGAGQAFVQGDGGLPAEPVAGGVDVRLTLSGIVLRQGFGLGFGSVGEQGCGRTMNSHRLRHCACPLSTGWFPRSVRGLWALLLTMAFGWGGMAEDQLLLEGFEDGFPLGWTAGDRDRAGVAAYWDAVSAEFGGVRAHTGAGKAYCAAVGYDGSGRLPAYRDSMAAFLRVVIDLSGYERATLRFWHAIAGIETGYDWAGVYGNGSVLWRSTNPTERWVKVEVDLTPFAGQTCELEFRFDSDASRTAEGWYLDDIEVTIVEGATPVLAVEMSRGQVVLSWPAAGSCFRLMSSPGLQPALWQPVAERVEVAGDRSVVTVAPAQESRYFVLRGGSRLVSGGWAASLGEAHTRAMGWEGPQARGEPVPVANGAGLPLGYIVPFRRQAEVFPETAALLETVATLKGHFGPLPEEGPENLPAEFFEALEDAVGPMGYVLVGADRENYPVLLAQRCLHPYYWNQDSARRRASAHWGGADVVLEGYAMPGPQEEYFVFRAGARWLFVHGRSLQVIESEDYMTLPRYGVPAELAADRDQAWAIAGSRGALHGGPEVKWIRDYNLIPIVDWTYWCVPTAYTMVIGFYDHYEAGLKMPGYGRLVDYWYENGTGHNVPNFLDELIDPALTPPNWRSVGLLAILNNPEWNGYAFQRTDVKGHSANDWAWSGLRSELDAERPTVWSNRPEDLDKVGHAMAAFGYRVSGGQRFVIVYNTWGTTRQQQYAEYNYNQWIEGGASGGTGYAQILPGGGSGSEDGILASPRGGDVVFGPSQIQWQVVGNSIKYTQLYDSVDAGRTWVFRNIVAIPAPGVYSQPWTPPSSTSRGRVRIRCLDAAWNLVAGDGSVANVYFQALPELMPVAGPSGFCNLRDGKLVVLVSNAGTVAATPTTTEVKFQCLGGPQAVQLPTPAIPAKGMVEVLFDIPGACWNFDCHFEIRVDVFNQVQEANESNNAVAGVCAG